jgi:DNA-directed RNA polymerase specialized sigma24 family protein
MVSHPHQKWSLTQEAFDGLLACLSPNRDEAGEKYLEIRRNLIRFFEWRGCSFPDDHADETVNRVARKVAEGEQILNPNAYFIGVARLLLLEILKARAKETTALAEMSNAPVEVPDNSGDEARVACLQECLQELTSENRDLIVQYYQGDKGEKIANRKKLTEKLGISVNTLRMRALRLREKLLECVQLCIDRS